MIFFISAIFVGCANQSSPFLTKLNWDYERDEIGRLCKGSSSLSPLCEVKHSNFLRAFETDYIRKDIQLQPHQLSRIVCDALMADTKTMYRSMKFKKCPFEMAAFQDGQITTDWQVIEGKECGLLWWKKKYQAEVQHVITISRSNKKSLCSNISISTEVRERPNENYTWVKGNAEFGRKSFLTIKSCLLSAVENKIIAEERLRR